MGKYLECWDEFLAEFRQEFRAEKNRYKMGVCVTGHDIFLLCMVAKKVYILAITGDSGRSFFVGDVLGANMFFFFAKQTRMKCEQKIESG